MSKLTQRSLDKVFLSLMCPMAFWSGRSRRRWTKSSDKSFLTVMD